MASFGFKSRFKNKIDKIGRDGISGMDSFKAIEKDDIPESKIHIPYSKLIPSGIKGMIPSKLSSSQNMLPRNNLVSQRCRTPYKILPQGRSSPFRVLDTFTSESKSPLNCNSNSLHQQDKSTGFSASSVKLPRIRSGIKNFRLSMKKKNFIILP